MLARLSLLLPLTALAACLQKPQEPIRIGMNVWPPYELLYLAQEKGYFREEGVEIELVDFSSYTGVLRAYHQGNVDGFLASLNELQIRENFQDLPAVVLVVDYSSGGDAVVARAGIRSLKDLRGKRIAFEESALGSYVLHRVLQIAGLLPGDVAAVNRLPEEGEQDFERGAVDAVVTYEPSLGRLMRAAGARVIFTSREIPGEIVDVLALRRSLLEERPDDARRVARAWFRALNFLKSQPQEAAAVMARREKVPPARLLSGLEETHIPDLRENLALLGSRRAPGPLHGTADRLGGILVRSGLTRTAPSAAELFRPEILGSL